MMNDAQITEIRRKLDTSIKDWLSERYAGSPDPDERIACQGFLQVIDDAKRDITLLHQSLGISRATYSSALEAITGEPFYK